MNIHKTKIQKKRTYIFIGIGAIILGVVLAALFNSSKNNVQETYIVERGSISQYVVATGRVKPAEDVSLAFERGGKIRNTNVKIGDQVSPGQALAYLDTTELQAQLLQAKANVDAQKARLDELKRGSRPEEIQIKESELKKAQQDLKNLYTGAVDVVNDAYTKADDAVRAKTDIIFSNDETDNPQLEFSTNDAQVQIDTITQRKIAGSELISWKKEIGALSVTTDQVNLLLDSSTVHISKIRAFLTRTLDAVNVSINVTQGTVDTYKTNLGVARSNINTAATAITNQQQLIAAQNIVVERINNELILARAGATKETITAQEAQVTQAEASVSTIQAQITQATLVSPIRGIVTKQDAKAGEIVTPNVPLISVISDKTLEIESDIPEIDIGNVSVGNTVRITLDAFPNETFLGSVAYIDPGETIKNGVVNFKVTIVFQEPNEKIRSGFTANLHIETQKKNNVLKIPQFVVREDGDGSYVQVLKGKEIINHPVSLGIRDTEGNIEILSGVSEGDTVVRSVVGK